MDVLSDLRQRLHSEVLKLYPSTISEIDGETSLVTQFNGYVMTTTLGRYSNEVTDYYKASGIIGHLTFGCELDGYYKENLDAYRSILNDFAVKHGGCAAFTVRVGTPKGFMSAGITWAREVFETDTAMTDEALMACFSLFSSYSREYYEFATKNLVAKKQAPFFENK